MAMPSSERHHFLSFIFIFSNVLLLVLSLEHPTSNAKDLSSSSSIALSSFRPKSLSSRSDTANENRGYGYPYGIAPTLTPIIHSRSDEFDNEAEVSKPKLYGSKLSTLDDPLKKSSLKKYKAPFSYEAARRQGFDGSEGPIEKRFRAYKEPKYRNFDELESKFLPRRIDYYPDPYGYEYVPKSARRPPVSPRDPYMSNGHADGFYPTVPKVKSYAAPYIHSGPKSISYGAGGYDDPSPYHDDHSYGHYNEDSYGGPSHYPTSGGQHDYQEDYAIESNKPITGDIRKRLLDYAGASDLYEGEPDYLQRIVRNKNKYGPVANDYYAYGRPGYRDSYREFPYVESKVSLLKKRRV
ncbi:hypothetical protein JTE90_012790 [Oedothorax gibbosus]|uniref:Uncharacterized protein n=1 Tax=Oedothorax gibbosus TaxID=931172 RepID=A0AAV6W333_9ARAC|nr:hypothetical protein JTE90_012790 [Oedothorax gibbosus]